jgi:hypothetical protein
MPWVGFEPTIPEFERAKTVHALERAATVIGTKATTLEKQNSITVSSRFLHHSKYIRKAEQHYSEQQIPSSQQLHKKSRTTLQ